jgi:ABC-type transport system involved in cytochrome c biogenesis permease subunit
MTWDEFLWFAIPAVLCWLSAGILVFKTKKTYIINGLMIAGIVIFAAFIIALWIGQERPPLRTIGETRLWYSFFLATVGFLTYRHWKYKWLLSFAGLVATVFVFVNILKPEIHSTNLMPALQSYWFVPHVTVYILSYAMLGAATIASIIQLINIKKNKTDLELYKLMDNVVYIGFAFLMLGMLMGAVWAKEAWGHYWSWDPKETWAFITSAAYLVYIHMRLQNYYVKFTLSMLSIAFILLMITWIGVNYLPAAQGSVHVYSN